MRPYASVTRSPRARQASIAARHSLDLADYILDALGSVSGNQVQQNPLQPDLQYVIHPDTSRAVPNAWALQLRVEISF